MDFFGRNQELALLRTPNWRDRAELVVLYGRRRVGKTALVEHAFSDQLVWRFDALEGQTTSAQLAHFHAQLLEVAEVPAASARGFADWHEALSALSAALERRPGLQLVIFWDEFQWAAEMKTYLVSLLKSFWDRELSHHRAIKLILCGSISSFMVKRVIRSRALYGRVDTEMNLKPLSLSEMRALCGTLGRRVDREILDIALTFGGIPAYLRQLRPQLSFQQNLDQQAFNPNGYFFGEFDRIFISHFGANQSYRSVIDGLHRGPRTAQQLAQSAGHETGGGFKTIIEDLCLAGFVERYTPLDKPISSKLVRYRLVDEYMHFYVQFIAPHRTEIASGQFSSLHGLAGPQFEQWRGYAFERLCRQHQRTIAENLQFAGVRYKFGTWFKRRMPDVPGAQIDLLFIRADNVITLCEAKVGRSIDAAALQMAIDNKRAALGAHFPRHAIQTVLIVPSQEGVADSVRRCVHEVIGMLDAKGEQP